MATSLKLVFDVDGGNKKLSLIFPYAKASATGAQIKALMQGIVADGAVYSPAPAAIVSAEFVDRTVSAVDLS